MWKYSVHTAKTVYCIIIYTTQIYFKVQKIHSIHLNEIIKDIFKKVIQYPFIKRVT